MRLPIVLLLTGSVLLGHAVGVPSIEPQAQPVQAQTARTPWKLWISAKSWAGQTVITKVYDKETHEAAGAWLTVDLAVQNATGTRQSVKDVLDWGQAELEDRAGNVYKADWEASAGVLQEEKFEGKPFGPGESRSVRLLFDVPQNVQVSKLKISGYDSKRNFKEFTINY
jgi:hypothetical protein